jgi:chromosome segregation ATPase
MKMPVRPKSVGAKLDALSTSVDQRFDQFEKRFDQFEKRFEEVDKRFEQVDKRFEEVDKRFDDLRQLILAEGEKTRLHFDVTVEQIKSERNLSLDRSAATDQQLVRFVASNVADHVAFEKRLTDHEVRLKVLEMAPEAETPDSSGGA